MGDAGKEVPLRPNSPSHRCAGSQGPTYTAITGQGHPQGDGPGLCGHPLILATKLGTGHVFTGYLWMPGQK